MTSNRTPRRFGLKFVIVFVLVVYVRSAMLIADWARELLNHGYAYSSAAIFFVYFFVIPVVAYGFYVSARRKHLAAMFTCPQCGRPTAPGPRGQCLECGNRIA